MKPLALAWPQRLLLTAGMAALAALASHEQWFWQQDEPIYDRLVGNWTYRPDPSLLIVAIDERSLQQLGQWPWPRATHARLLDVLTDARTERVALDLVLSEPDPRDNGQDHALADAIARNGTVLLPVVAAPAAGERMAEELLPITPIITHAAGLAHTDVEIDGDGIARGVYLKAGIGSPHWPALGLALAGTPPPPPGLRDQTPGIHSPYQWRRDHYVRLRYAGPSERFPQVSYVDVLNGDVPVAELSGRRVIVGMTASGISPRLLTPTSRESWMSGTEYQANVASMLLSDKVIALLPPAWQHGLVALLVALCCLCMSLSRPPPWVTAVLAVPVTVLLSLVLLRGFNLWFAPSAAIAGILLVVLGWGVWRVSAWQRQANTDALTGLGNRLRFEQHLRRMLDGSRRSGKPLTLMLMDVDNFKHYNDALGHPVGDAVLQQVGRLIRQHARRPQDLAARFGGDEFALILPDTDQDDAVRRVEALLAQVRQLAVPTGNGQTTGVTITVGLYTAKAHGEHDSQPFIERTDAALYEAKAAGRDGYRSHREG